MQISPQKHGHPIRLTYVAARGSQCCLLRELHGSGSTKNLASSPKHCVGAAGGMCRWRNQFRSYWARQSPMPSWAQVTRWPHPRDCQGTNKPYQRFGPGRTVDPHRAGTRSRCRDDCGILPGLQPASVSSAVRHFQGHLTGDFATVSSPFKSALGVSRWPDHGTLRRPLSGASRSFPAFP
jgi:hypothetical protein